MYSSASAVAQMTPNLVSGSATYSGSTIPTLVAVELFLSTGCALIHVALAAEGYSTPVSSSTAPAVYGSVVHLETLYAAAMAEMTRLTGRTSVQERTRGQMLMKLYDTMLKSLLSTDLSSSGLSKSSTASIYLGGTSKARKETLSDDTDRVRPAFSRDLMKWPGTIGSDDRLEGDR